MAFVQQPLMSTSSDQLTPSSRRFIVMALLFVTVVINYLDRSNLSIAAPSLATEFGIDPVHMGLVFSAFGWTYTPLQIPGGWLVDRVHPRMLYPATIVLWSFATLALGLSDGLAMLLILRMAVGLFEVPSFLMNNRIATTWFGERERATCIAVYTAAEFVGLAFLTPVLAWLKVTFGWPSVFFATGILGLLWAAAFWRSYRDPRDFPGVNAAEIELIASSGGIPDLSQRIASRHRAREHSLWRDFGVVLGRRKLWGIYFGHFAWGTTSSFFLTWFPTYLVTYPAHELHQGGLLRLIAVPRRVRRRAVFRPAVGTGWCGAASASASRASYRSSAASRCPPPSSAPASSSSRRRSSLSCRSPFSPTASPRSTGRWCRRPRRNG